MAYTYKGTKITGTETTAKAFKKSEIKKAKKNQTYLNTSTGHVYVCTKAGKPTEAKWKYVRTDIIAKPTLGVTKLGAPVRTTISGNNHYMQASWAVPPALTNAQVGSRASNLKIEWVIGGPAKGQKWTSIINGAAAQTYSRINLNGITLGGKSFTRSSFYPLTTYRKLTYVSARVTPYNAKGYGKASQVVTRNFTAPREPSISAFGFNTETGDVTVTITTNAGADYRERYDTRYIMTVKNTRTGITTNVHNTSSTSTSISLTYDASDYQQLNYGQYIQVTVKAWARGYAGDSKTVSRTIYISYPAQATISAVNISSRGASGKCTVKIKTNSSASHPVDRVRLEYLANVAYASAGSIPGGEEWSSTDIMDDSLCTALAMPVTDLIPDAGNYTWVRIKSYHLSETVLYRYSNPIRVKGLESPAATAADDNIKLLSITAGADGESLIVRLGWNANGQDDSTGTELTWSDEENTWTSTEDPNRYTFTWSDGNYTYNGVTYRGSALITIKGLEEGKKYFVKARRYLEGETTTYSGYSNIGTCYTNTTPDAVVASCDRYVPTGSSLPIYWTFSGNGLQTSWQIVAKGTMTQNFNGNGTKKAFVVSSKVDSVVSVTVGGTATSAYTRSGQTFTFTTAPANNAKIVIKYTGDKTVIANGQGSLGSTQISGTRLAQFATNNSITFTVQVSTGSEYVISEEHTVSIIDPPQLQISAESMLSVQPLSFTATVTRLCDLIVIVSSQGASGQFPTGLKRQTSGDAIHSAVYSPVWVENQNEDTWSATVTIPGGLDFWDLGKYTISAVAIDRTTGLQSNEAKADFAVAWSHQAPVIDATITYSATTDTEVVEDKAYYTYDSTEQTYVDVMPEGTENPASEGWYERTVTEYVTLTPIDTIDDTGMHHKSVQIALTPPPGSTSTDLYDLYRLTGDGATLIGEGFPLNHTATDDYAPFGDDMTHYYRIASRTADGDVSFSDIEYVADGSMMRFDWAGGVLELPYNLSVADKYKKDVEIRKHMNGINDGYWNQNIERSASLSSDVIRLTQQSEIDAARQLARYAGPVFVRTPDGSAYEADVQVSDLSTEGIIAAIAIDATEIGITQEFMLPTPYVLSGESDGSGTSGESGTSGG